MTGRDRNKPCSCGSGKKYKRCCWDINQFPEAKAQDIAHARYLEQRAARLARGEKEDSALKTVIATTALISGF